MLRAEGLYVSYGKHVALHNISLRLGQGEVVAVLGANGAGKSTLLKAVAGLVRPSAGQITLDSMPILGLPTHTLVELGVVLVPERGGVFADLTVRENLLLGAYPARARERERDNLKFVLNLFPRLSERLHQTARTMSGGEQRMLAIGRALMGSPRVLLLDEPSLGLSPLLARQIFSTIAAIREHGVAVLLVEQNARQGLAIADRGYLLETGRVVGEGSAAALRSDPQVQRVYLGMA